MWLDGCSGIVHGEAVIIFFHICTVQLDTIKSYLLSNGCTIKYSKKNVKIYIKINTNMLLNVSVQNDHHQGAWHLCFA
jgi:hypothetical protein